LSYNGASGQANIQADSSGGNTYLTFGTSSAGSVSERLRIDSNGNMGIGGSETTVFNGVGGEMRLVVLGNDSTSTITNNTNSAIAIVNTNHTAGNLAGLHFGRADTDYSPNYAGASIVAQFPEAQVTGQYPKGDLAFLTSTATNSAPSEKMRIDSVGNVGIGVSSMTNKLVLPNAAYFAMQDTGGAESLAIRANTSNAMEFLTGGGIKATITSTGSVGISKSAYGSGSTDGFWFDAGAAKFLQVSSTGNSPLFLNRNGSDGGIVNFYKSGTNVGSIGVDNTDNLTISGNSSHCGLNFSSDDVNPYKNGAYTDGTTSLGSSSTRFNNLYLSGGVYLGGTGSANHLDNYEEGTWTPRFTDHTGSDRFSSYNLQTGNYVKIGNTCFCGMDIIGATGAVTSGSYLNIGNLPFNVKSGSNATIVFNAGYLDSIGYTTIQGGFANTNPNIIFLVASGTSYAGPGGLTNGSRMIAGFVFQTQ
jgi:hypothetical protein